MFTLPVCRCTQRLKEGVRLAYADGYLRKSVCDPFTRKNTTDNLPAIIHVDVVSGSHLKIIAMPKGGGSEKLQRRENILIPAAGIDGIKKFVLDTVEAASANPCPPIIVGVGIGGSLPACVMAKKALLRPVGEQNRVDERAERIGAKLLESVNNLGIGPAGLGGRVALAVHIEMMPCHIASLPVAVNVYSVM